MRKKVFLYIAVFAAVILLIAGFYYFSKAITVNYTIAGVPYTGFYNFYLTSIPLNAAAKTVSAVSEVLGYWGDKRFDTYYLSKQYPDNRPGAPLSEIKKFFEDQGYQTYGWTYQKSDSAGPDKLIAEIKKYVNPTQKIPVMILEKRSPDSTNAPLSLNVVIGVSDVGQKLIVQDYYFGNNYQISYQDFKRMLLSSSNLVMLAVWPSEQLKSKLKPVSQNSQYPARLQAMDKLGELLATKYADALYDFGSKNTTEGLVIFTEFADDPNFEYLPAAFKVSLLSQLAERDVNAGKPEEAIKIIREKVLPINLNLIQSTPKGWDVPAQDEYSYPLYVLARAYLKMGDKSQAAVVLAEMKTIKVSQLYQTTFDANVKALENAIAGQSVSK